MKSWIVIECAMRSEAESFIRNLENPEERSICSFSIVEGKIYGKEIAVGFNRVGMINAAVLTKVLIDEYRPKCIIALGTAGAYLKTLKVNDIILGEKIYNANIVHMSDENCDVLEKITEEDWKRDMCFASSPSLLEIGEKVPYDKGNVVVGNVASADFWSFDAGAIEKITRRIPAICEDMESFSEAQVCQIMDTDFLCIRVISNNELSGESFDISAAENGQNFLKNLIEII